MDKNALAFLIAFLFISFFAMAAVAKEEPLPVYLMSQDAHLKRCSRGNLKAFNFFHVGYAALYLDKCQRIGNIFDSSPKTLRFVYERSIPASAFREAADEYLKTNLGAQYFTWQQTLDQFNKGYRDIKDGDYYDLIYDPETGLKLRFNGEQVAELGDPGIGLAYFNIWFGKEPFSDRLKEDLLTPEKFIGSN